MIYLWLTIRSYLNASSMWFCRYSQHLCGRNKGLFRCWEMKIRTKLSLGSRLQEVRGRAAMPHPADALVCGLSIVFSLKACYISLSMPECVFEREKENLAMQAGHCHPHPFFLRSLGKQWSRRPISKTGDSAMRSQNPKSVLLVHLFGKSK